MKATITHKDKKYEVYAPSDATIVMIMLSKNDEVNEEAWGLIDKIYMKTNGLDLIDITYYVLEKWESIKHLTWDEIADRMEAGA